METGGVDPVHLLSSKLVAIGRRAEDGNSSQNRPRAICFTSEYVQYQILFWPILCQQDNDHIVYLDLQWEPLQMKTNGKCQQLPLQIVEKIDQNDTDEGDPMQPDMTYDINYNSISIVITSVEYHCRLNREDDDVDLKISIWNVDLFIPEVNSPVKSAGLKFNKKQMSTQNSSATFADNFRFDDGPMDNCPKGPSPGEVLQALTTYDI